MAVQVHIHHLKHVLQIQRDLEELLDFLQLSPRIDQQIVIAYVTYFHRWLTSYPGLDLCFMFLEQGDEIFIAYRIHFLMETVQHLPLGTKYLDDIPLHK